MTTEDGTPSPCGCSGKPDVEDDCVYDVVGDGAPPGECSRSCTAGEARERGHIGLLLVKKEARSIPSEGAGTGPKTAAEDGRRTALSLLPWLQPSNKQAEFGVAARKHGLAVLARATAQIEEQHAKAARWNPRDLKEGVGDPKSRSIPLQLSRWPAVAHPGLLSLRTLS